MNSKLKETLEEVVSLLSTWTDHLPSGIQEEAQEAIDKAEAALAEPLKNCEVGTVGEQIKRFYNEYYAENSRCKRMWSFGECAIHWSQMPYKKEVVK